MVLTAPVVQIANAQLVHVPVVKLAPVASLVDARELTADVDLTASALLAPVPVVKLAPVASLVDAREQTANVDLTASALLVIVLASPSHELQAFEHA